MKLWISTAMKPPGDPYGLVAIVADTKDEAIAKARTAIEADPSDHRPTQQYVQELLAALDGEIEEVAEGVFIDWDAGWARLGDPPGLAALRGRRPAHEVI